MRNRLEVCKRKEVSVSLCLFFFVPSGWNHLPAERPHRRAGCCQPSGIAVEPQKDHNREHPAASHSPVQVSITPLKLLIHTPLFDHAKAAASGSEVTDPLVTVLQTKLNFVFVAPSDSTSSS